MPMRAQRYCKPAASSIFGVPAHIHCRRVILWSMWAVYFGCIL